MALDPEFALPYVGLADNYLVLTVVAMPPSEAMPRAREPVPWHVRSWHSFFYLLLVGRLDDARQVAERAIEDNPLSQLRYFSLAPVLEAQGRDDEARAALERACACVQHLGDFKSAYESGLRAAFELVRGEVDLSVEWAGAAVDERYESTIGMFIRANQRFLERSSLWPDPLRKMHLPS